MENILIAFDCFGVILKRFTKEFSNKYNLLNYFDEMVKIFDKADRNIITHRKCMDEIGELVKIDPKIIEEEFINLSIPNIDMINFIKENKNKYHIVMISNATSFLNIILDHYNLKEYFEKIYISSEMKLYKPEEPFYKHVMDEYKCVKSIMVDDKIENIIGARNAGMNGIVYSSFNEFLKEINNLL